MTNLKKKIVAVVTTLTVAAWMIPGSAFALTAAELQVQIDALLAQLATLQTQLTTLEGTGTGTAVTGCAITSFDRALQSGMSGNDVKCLQIVLNSDSATQVAASGVGSSGNETTYFGPLTKAAVIKFQEKYASEVLASWGLTKGTGYVGSTTRAKLDSVLTAGVPAAETPAAEEPAAETPVAETPAATGNSTIELAADTPETSQIALQAQDVLFTKIKFYGGASGVTITKILLTRGGVSADADLSAIKLYDGITQVGSSQALNTNTHKATFSSLSWKIAAGETKYLTVKGSIAGSGTATVGDGVKLGIALAADITADATLDGTFPIYGKAKTIAGISVGYPDITKQTTPATTTLISGAVEQEIASWRITATTTEGLEVHSIKITHTGSATRDDVTNIKLKVDGVQIGSTVVTLDTHNAATFDLSASPLKINSSASKTVYAYADIAAGIFTSRTVIFEITQYTDLVAYGGNSGGSVIFRSNTNQGFTKQTANTMTVGQGTLTVALDTSLNPAAQSYVKGTTNRLMTAFKFSTGSTEGVRVVKLVLTLSGAGSATDLANISLWDGTTQIAGPASVIGSQITFGANTIGWDTSGLFDIDKSVVKYIQVKADIPSGATAASAAVALSIAAASDVYADGLSSKYDVPSGSITLSSGTGTAHTISAQGTLTIGKSSLSPVAQTYVKGSLEKEFFRFNLTAGSGEDVSVTAIAIQCDKGAVATQNCASGDITNVKILKSDGTQYGSTVSSPVASASFSGSLTVPASGTQTLKVIADIPSATNATTGGVILSLNYDASGDDLTATGAYSAQTVSESSSATADNMAIDAGSLTLAAAAVPADQQLIKGVAGASFAGLTMTAGTAENVRVTYVKLTVSSSGQASTTDVGNIALYDGATQLTSKKNLTASTETGLSQALATHHTVAFSASDFTNSSGIDITKGQQKIITVKADLLSGAGTDHTVALGVSSTADFVVTGLSSNTEITETRTLATGATGVNYDYDGTGTAIYEVTIKAAGTLTMANNAGRPITAIHAVGQEGVGITGTVTGTGVTFHKIDLTASLEDIYVKSVTVERATGDTTAGAGSRDADFGAITIWDGSTQLGTAQYMSNATTTFNFAEGSYWKLSKGITKTLVVKADLSGIASATGYGANTGDSPLLRIDDITVQGVSSGNTSIATTQDLGGNHSYLRQSKPTIATASLPTSVLSTGEKTLYRWTVTADAKGAIGWRRIVFNMTGSLGAKTITASTTDPAGMGTQDGVYVNNSGLAVKYVNDFKIWNLTDNVQVTGTTSDAAGTAVTSTTGLIIRADADAGTGYNLMFIPASEEIVAAGETRTYELRGTVLATSPALTTGDSILTKIQDLANIATTSNYYAVSRDDSRTTDTMVTEDIIWVNNYATTSASFIWSDRSAGSHTQYTGDWSNDYKVSGLPATTLTLSK